VARLVHGQLSSEGLAGGTATVSRDGNRPCADSTGRYGVGVIPIVDEVPARDELLDLYGSVGWSVYTRDPERLERALAGSDLVATARDADGLLVGLVRTVGDGATICYVQDLLVRPDLQRGGVGRALVEHVRASPPAAPRTATARTPSTGRSASRRMRSRGWRRSRCGCEGAGPGQRSCVRARCGSSMRRIVSGMSRRPGKLRCVKRPSGS
jgi:GNAT superfamily N-acetyltransferase